MSVDYGYNFGLEQEFFYCANDESSSLVLPPSGCPRDNAGWLVEARGKPYRDPIESVFSLKANIYRIEKLYCGSHDLLIHHRLKVPMRLKTLAIRTYGIPRKDKVIDNLYDDALTDEQLEWDYAGIHVNISKMGSPQKDGARLAEMFDHVPIIKWLDERFEADIKNSDRLLGSYSIKSMIGGMGLEYRSLPTTVNLDKLGDALVEMKKELHLY